MKHGHAAGTKRERKPRRSTTDRYKAMSEAIAKKLETMTQAEMIGLKEREDEQESKSRG